MTAFPLGARRPAWTVYRLAALAAVCLPSCTSTYKVEVSESGRPVYDSAEVSYEVDDLRSVLHPPRLKPVPSEQPAPGDSPSVRKRQPVQARLDIQYPHPDGDPDVARLTLRMATDSKPIRQTGYRSTLSGPANPTRPTKGGLLSKKTDSETPERTNSRQDSPETTEQKRAKANPTKASTGGLLSGLFRPFGGTKSDDQAAGKRAAAKDDTPEANNESPDDTDGPSDLDPTRSSRGGLLSGLISQVSGTQDVHPTERQFATSDSSTVTTYTLDLPRHELDLLFSDLANSGYFDGTSQAKGKAHIAVRVDKGSTSKSWSPEPRLNDFVMRSLREGRRSP